MKTRSLCVALLLWSIGAGIALATPVDDKLAVFKKAMNDELATKPEDKETPMLRQTAQSLDNTGTSGMGGPASPEAIAMLLSRFDSDAVHKAGKELIAAMEAERKAKTDECAKQFDSLKKRLTELIKTATKPEELDDILGEFQKMQTAGQTGAYGQSSGIYQQVSGMLEVAKMWQTYLSHKSTDQGGLAYRDLEQLSQNNNAMEVIPRSRLLALMTPKSESGNKSSKPDSPKTEQQVQAEVLEIQKNVLTLDQIAPAIKKIEEVQPYPNGMYNPAAALKQLQGVLDSIKAGAPVTVQSNFGRIAWGDHDLNPELFKQYDLFILQHYLATFKVPPPAKDDTPDSYLQRTMQDAGKAQDWALLKEALTARMYLDERSSLPNGLRQDVDGVTDLREAISQDTAGQYMLAVSSYQKALKELPDGLVSPKVIGDKLAAIKKDHPAEYEQGMMLFLAPPASPRNYYGMPGYNGMPGYPPAPTQRAPANLIIPGKSTANPDGK